MKTSRVKQSIIPASMSDEPALYKLSPALAVGELLFLSGQIGFDEDGTLPTDPSRQAERVFARIGQILEAAGGSFRDLVSLTSYHVGNFTEAESWWRPAVAAVMNEPYPAWAAVEVSGLAVPGAVVEVSAIAAIGLSER